MLIDQRMRKRDRNRQRPLGYVVFAKANAAKEPKLNGILVKDYFSLIGSTIAILGVAITIGVGSCNTQLQLTANEKAALEQRAASELLAQLQALSAQFIDAQNRLSKVDNASERINAVNLVCPQGGRPGPWKYREYSGVLMVFL